MTSRKNGLLGACDRFIPTGLRRPRPVRPEEVPSGVSGVELSSVRSDVGELWFPTDDRVMLPYILKNATWEPDEGALLRSLARPGCRFLDVGANVGYFSLFIAMHALDATIDCVEPSPLIVQLLRLNLWGADVDAAVWPLALGDHSGALALETAPTNYGDGRVLNGRDHAVARTVVPVAAGDEIFVGRSFDLIKVDVQGNELGVLTGLRQTIARSPGVHIVTEFWPTAIAERGEEPLRTLAAYREFGWTMSVLLDQRLIPATDQEVLALCQSGGRDGQVNLLLYPA